jgi:hypothetical protein
MVIPVLVMRTSIDATSLLASQAKFVTPTPDGADPLHVSKTFSQAGSDDQMFHNCW